MGGKLSKTPKEEVALWTTPRAKLTPAQAKHVDFTYNYFFDLYDGPRPVTAETLREAAGASVASLTALGFATGKGLFGIPTSFKVALKLFEQASQSEHPAAFRLLAICHRKGWGTGVNSKQSGRFDLRGAELGDHECMFNVGLNYQNGVAGFAQSFAKAVEWYQKSADLGHAGSQLNLGMLYEKGEGVGQNWETALRFYTLATVSDGPDGVHAQACVNVANCHSNGWGTPVNLEQAVKWLQRGVDLESGLACFKLAECYEVGAGVPIDLCKAEGLYGKAVQYDDPDALFRLANFLYNGWGSLGQDQRAAMAMYKEAERLGATGAAQIVALMNVYQSMGSTRPVWQHPSQARLEAAEADGGGDGEGGGEGDEDDTVDIRTAAAREALLSLVNGPSVGHAACAAGDLAEVQKLGQTGVNFNAANAFGVTPVLCAAASGKLEVVRYLVEEGGAQLDPVDDMGITPLIAACMCGHADVVRYILEKRPADANLEIAVSEGGSITPLGIAIIHGHVLRYTDVAPAFLDAGVDPSGDVTTTGISALVFAAMYNNVNAARALVKAGAKGVPSPNDDDGETPLHVALHDNLEMAKLLVSESGADINAVRKSDGATALALAILMAKLDMVRWLVKLGADVTIADKEGETPIHCAAIVGSVEMAKVLLEANADVNAANEQGMSPLLHAVEEDRVDMIKFLLERGADVNHLSKLGFNALGLAMKNGKVFTADLLKEAGCEYVHVHPWITCDGEGGCCDKEVNLRGVRYHKLGEDFDLCQVAFDRLDADEKELYEQLEHPGDDVTQEDALETIEEYCVQAYRGAVVGAVRASVWVQVPPAERSAIVVMALVGYINTCYMSMLKENDEYVEGVFAAVPQHSPVCVLTKVMNLGRPVLEHVMREIGDEPLEFADLDALRQELTRVITNILEHVGWKQLFAHRCTGLSADALRDEWRRNGCPDEQLVSIRSLGAESGLPPPAYPHNEQPGAGGAQGGGGAVGGPGPGPGAGAAAGHPPNQLHPPSQPQSGAGAAHPGANQPPQYQQHPPGQPPRQPPQPPQPPAAGGLPPAGYLPGIPGQPPFVFNPGPGQEEDVQQRFRDRVMDELEFQLHAPQVNRPAHIVRRSLLVGHDGRPPIHVHLHVPSPAFPFYTFVTEGMSTFAMPVTPAAIANFGPEARTQCAHAEFVAYVPKGVIDARVAKGEELSEVWEVHMLLSLVEMVLENKYWIWAGHTLPLQVQGFEKALITPIEVCGDRPRNERPFGTVPPTADGQPQITFFAVVPLTAAEQAKKSAETSAAIFPLIGNAAADPAKPISFYVDPNRKCSLTG
eukprot:m.383186 g.383186  ORF g.383186 m.383186 type:complete len:1312 (+) comp16728_c0_seq11:151-4086(+)